MENELASAGSSTSVLGPLPFCGIGSISKELNVHHTVNLLPR